MADIDTSSRQCAFATLALSTLGADPVWDTRLTNYLRLQALAQGECDFGKLARANDDNARVQMHLESKYGTSWRSNPIARADADPSAATACAAEDVWTESLCEPYWQAARDLAMTPAPTLAAAMFKVQVIKWDELDNASSMTREPMGIITEDMARLAAAPINTAAVAETEANDAEIIGAWNTRHAAYDQFNALPFSDEPDTAQTPEERAQWAIIDATEETIRATIAASPHGAAIQLWTALQHDITDRQDEAAVLRRDLEWFKDDKGQDWTIRLILSALRSLNAIEAA